MGNQPPFFSFIMGVKDCGVEFSESLSSIVAQSFSDWELILINDGSKPAVKENLERLVAGEPRIRLFHQENMGLTATLQNAVSLARGQFLVRQDADDFSTVNRLERLHGAIMQGDFDVVLSRATQFGEGRRSRLIPSTMTIHGINVELLAFGNIFVHGTLCVRKKLFEEINYDRNYYYAQDYDLICRLFKSAAKIGFIHESLYHLRMSRTSITATKLAEQNECSRRIAVQHFGSAVKLIPAATGARKWQLKFQKKALYAVAIFFGRGRLEII